MAGNQAIQVNPSIGVQQHITTRGSDWLWAVFAIMLFTDLAILVWGWTLPRGQKVFHHLAVIILTTASIAYFSMASNLGYAAIATEFASGSQAGSFPAGTYRQIWYARYIDWTITTPALLLELVLASGLPLSDIITLVFFDLVMIITGLIGALVQSTYKWGFYTFGCAALFYIWWVLIGPARTTAGVIGPDYKRSFTTSAAILSFLWLLYPIAWGLADGGSVISPDGEMVFYGVLDVLAKPVFCVIHLFSLSKLDLTALQLHSGKFSTGTAAGVGAYERGEKHRYAGNGHEHVTPGTIPASTTTAGTGNGTTTTTATKDGKRGLFGRKGKYDAPTSTMVGTTPMAGTTGVSNTTTNGLTNGTTAAAEPRLSQATAVSH